MMKRATRLLIYILMMVLLVSGACASGFASNPDAIDKAAKSVLQIAGTHKDDPEMLSLGSGFIAFNSSTLITNYHVIDDLSELYAWDDDDTDYEHPYEIAYILCADKEADIAILEFASPTKLQPVELYPDDQLKRGSPVVAIGSPDGGSKNTVSTGIISSVYDRNGIPEIQITAAISHGSSGGALFNDDGKVIGVTSATSAVEETQNINFAINIAVAQAMYNAWDGSRYTFDNFKTTAKMDFTGVYDHAPVSGDSIEGNTENESENPIVGVQAAETWACPNCGKENTDRFCLDCGTEKPSWICTCGRQNSSKFCGSCGSKAEDLVIEFDRAMEYSSEKKFTEAIRALENLGEFDSGSFVTSEGSHVVAKDYIAAVYYQQGMALIAVGGGHEEILDCFKKAGDYSDAHEQIRAENDRYSAVVYADALTELENGNYLTAIEIFNRIDGYSDAKERIKQSYYLYGLSLLNEHRTDDARDAFVKADDYPGAADQIALIQEAEKEADYNAAIRKYDEGDYETAKAVFVELSGYKESDKYIKRCEIGALRNTNDPLLKKDSLYGWNQIIKELEPYMEYEEAQEYWKETKYKMARFYRELGDFSKAIELYKEADDYDDASQVLMDTKIEYYDSLLKGGQYTAANKFLEEELVPYGYETEKIIVKPGDNSEAVAYVLNLVRIMEFGRDIPKNETEYSDQYVESIKNLEEYFGFDADKILTLDEYAFLQDLIYKGAIGERVQQLVEKLFDLGYLKSLDKDHTLYVNGYYNGIKTVEKELDLNVDGVVTPEEFEKIMALKVEIARPENVQAKVNKDTVTLTWSKVPGALIYEIYAGSPISQNREKLGETGECRWVQKDVVTGETHDYIVVAKKYTVESEAYVSVYAEKYYIPVSIKELNENYAKYEGKYVEIKKAGFEDWLVMKDKEKKEKNYNSISWLQYSDGYDLKILCTISRYGVEFVLKNYKGWGWDYKKKDLATLCYFSDLYSISGKGVVQGKSKSPWLDGKRNSDGSYPALEYMQRSDVPSIVLEEVSWEYTN